MSFRRRFGAPWTAVGFLNGGHLHVLGRVWEDSMTPALDDRWFWRLLAILSGMRFPMINVLTLFFQRIPPRSVVKLRDTGQVDQYFTKEVIRGESIIIPDSYFQCFLFQLLRGDIFINDCLIPLRIQAFLHILSSPLVLSTSPWKKINLNKGIRIAIIVSGSKVSCLKNMDDKVAKVFVVIDLKLNFSSDWMRTRFCSFSGLAAMSLFAD